MHAVELGAPVKKTNPPCVMATIYQPRFIYLYIYIHVSEIDCPPPTKLLQEACLKRGSYQSYRTGRMGIGWQTHNKMVDMKMETNFIVTC